MHSKCTSQAENSRADVAHARFTGPSPLPTYGLASRGALLQNVVIYSTLPHTPETQRHPLKVSIDNPKFRRRMSCCAGALGGAVHPKDEAPRGDEACDHLVTGPLGKARRELRELLTPEAETLVTILGWIEVAMECSLDPGQSKNVRDYCQHALKLLAAIDQRNRAGTLPKPVAACLESVRKEVTTTINQLDRRRSTRPV